VLVFSIDLAPSKEEASVLIQLHRSFGALQDVLAAMRHALELNRRALLLDPDVRVSALTARLNDGRSVTTIGTTAPDESLVRTLYQAFEDIATQYEDMEDRRKPRLSELLETAAFILGPDNQGFVDTPTRSGVADIKATVEKP
jgi:hypothetical protein